MFFVYEIPIILILLVFLGILGIMEIYISTIAKILVVIYLLMEAFSIYFIRISRNEHKERYKSNSYILKKVWISMYICSVLRVIITCIALYYSLMSDARLISEGSFSESLKGWYNGFVDAFVALVGWFGSFFVQVLVLGDINYGKDLNKNKVVILNIAQILGALIIGFVFLLNHKIIVL